jgi:hypothetical protein
MPRFQDLPDIAVTGEGVRSPMFEELSAIADALGLFLGDFRMPDGYEGVRLDQVYAIDGTDIQSLICAADRLNTFLHVLSPAGEPWWIVLGIDRNSSWRKIQGRYRLLATRVRVEDQPIVAKLDALKRADDQAKKEVFQ